ncbi:GNAT family N-acetyltransferase [Streptococcus castoreus]|uniref:GNAT family N-acetyltransferase n=1 Tax=Streptococcus castoreus TaxID=254786 RepID=UPI000414D52C|nr:GNAT family N-acetyltransferase [Streptococcus castoreus]
MSYKTLMESGEPVFKETVRYKYFKNAVTSECYFSNYISYKHMPSLHDFKRDMAYLAAEQMDYHSDYSFVFFAENAELTEELSHYLKETDFKLEKHIIFTNLLVNLKLVPRAVEGVSIVLLDETRLDAYVAMKYRQALQYGQLYADQMKADTQTNLLENGSKVYLAIKDDEIIGDVTAWFFDDYVEIDDFFVDEAYRGQGIGTSLQWEASRGFEKVILISEEENRAMYEHQGYQEVAYYWTALRSPRS